MANKTTFIGICSNCRKEAGVIRKCGVQLCGVCISNLQTFSNQNAFQYEGKAKRIARG